MIGVCGAVLVMLAIGVVTQKIILEETGVLIEIMNFQQHDIFVLVSIVVVGMLGGLWSAIHVYHSDLAKNLQPVS